MHYEDRVEIVTPEGVTLHLTLAGLGSRALAAMIDTLFKLLILVALVAAFFGGAAVVGAELSLGDPRGAVLVGYAIAVVLIFIVNFFYDVLFETLASGRTPGKKAQGLKVVQVGGAPVRFTSSAVRNIVRIVDSLPTAYAVGMISILATSKNQRLGDLAAGTMVIREVSGSMEQVFKAPVPRGGRAEGDVWDVSTVTAEDLSTVRQFLERRLTLTPEARARLAWDLAAALKPKVSGAKGDLHPETFLERVAAEKAAKS